MDRDAATDIIRLPAEERHRLELEALSLADRYPQPPGWRLSPRMVETFILGGHDEFRKADGSSIRISPKYLGDRALVQAAIVSKWTGELMADYRVKPIFRRIGSGCWSRCSRSFDRARPWMGIQGEIPLDATLHG